jgi:HlyD family secretion protein
LVVLLTMAALPICADAQEREEPALEALPSVTVDTVDLREMLSVVPFVGSMKARNEVQVYPQISGHQIIQIIPDVGDQVTRGQIVVKLRSDALEAQLAQAEAELAGAEAQISQARNRIASTDAAKSQAEAELARYESLRSSGTVSQASYDQALVAAENARADALSARDGLVIAEAQHKQAEAARSLAALNLDWTRIQAPVDGVVASRNAKVGAMTGIGGEPLMTIIENGQFEFDVEVIETDIGSIEPGDPALLDVAGIGRISGIVRMVPPTVDPITRLGNVMITPVAHPGFRGGLFASGTIVIDRHEALTVPITAVLDDAEGSFVQVVADGAVERRSVVPGIMWQDRQEIVQGLAAGDEVIARAGAFFRNGDQVRPVSPGERQP